MSEKQFFTSEQLPYGKIMLIAKSKSGQELATVLEFSDPVDRVLNTYQFFLDTVRDMS
jgi:hypothetical protein